MDRDHSVRSALYIVAYIAGDSTLSKILYYLKKHGLCVLPALGCMYINMYHMYFVLALP